LTFKGGLARGTTSRIKSLSRYD